MNRNLITYQADSPALLKRAFEESVDDYLQTCIDLNRKAKKPLKGQFNVRITPELHKAATLRAAIDQTSLNEIVSRSLNSFLTLV